jgi:hypothetical protein
VNHLGQLRCHIRHFYALLGTCTCDGQGLTFASVGHQQIFFDEVAKRGEVYEVPKIKDGMEPQRKDTKWKGHQSDMTSKDWTDSSRHYLLGIGKRSTNDERDKTTLWYNMRKGSTEPY